MDKWQCLNKDLKMILIKLKFYLHLNKNKMKLTLALILTSFLHTTTFSQKSDYKIMRESITRLSCKTFDSLTVAETNHILKNIDTNLFDKNIDIYYRDLGWSYYRLYLYTKDTVLIRSSLDSYLKANFHNPNSSATLWQLASLNCILGECSIGKLFFENYKSVTEKKYWREEEIISMTKRCDN